MDPDPLNCGKDGYLMAKLLSMAASPSSSFQQMRRRSHDVAGMDGQTYRLQSILMGAPAAEDRFQVLNRMRMPDGRKAAEIFVDELCVIDPSVSYGINFDSFGKELAKWTDWFYAAEGKGSLFLRYVTAADAQAKGLPLMAAGSFGAETGSHEYEPGFLYIILVCAGQGTGFGKKLVDVAERFAIMLGLKFIVLSALPHVVTYYHDRLGYKFIDHTGKAIDATPWVGIDEKGRDRLYPDAQVQTRDD